VYRSRGRGRAVERLLARLDALADNSRRITSVNRNVGFFTSGYNYLIQVLPALIVAPLFIRGEAEFRVIAQAGIAFAPLLGAFSVVVNQCPDLSSHAAVTARLGALGQAIDGARAAGRQDVGVVEDHGRVAREALTLRAANGGRLPVNSPSAIIRHGTRLLVTGRNEVAQAARFRAVAGLGRSGGGANNPAAVGRVVVPAPTSVPAAGNAPRTIDRNR
jgi:putative ATP-binding cassette transporter